MINTDNLECKVIVFFSFLRRKLITEFCRWDALGPPMEKPENEDDTSGGMNAKEEDEYQEGRVWRVQAHAKNSISCMKVDPVNGSGVSFFFSPHNPRGQSHHLTRDVYSFSLLRMTVPSDILTFRPSNLPNCFHSRTKTCLSTILTFYLVRKKRGWWIRMVG